VTFFPFLPIPCLGHPSLPFFSLLFPISASASAQGALLRRQHRQQPTGIWKMQKAHKNDKKVKNIKF
jgi:hypothetical protein